MKTYFGYVRVSTARQGEGVSLDEQQSAIEAYARGHALKIVGWFRETESASKRGRPVFAEMIDALGRQRVDGVVMHKIDRSARHLGDWVWVGELIDHGVDVRFVQENLDLSSRSGRLTGDLLAVIAADYSRNLRDEVKKGLYGRLKQGIYPFHAPIGYLDRGGGKPKVIDPVKGPLVRQAFELYASGGYTFQTLRLELHRRGLTQRSGRPLVMETVSRILNNPFYIGIIRLRRSGMTYPGRHAPLITKALYDRVQRVLRGKTNTKVVVHDFALRRILRCASCGYALTGERQKGIVYYRCHQRACRGVSVREDQTLSALRAFLDLTRLLPEEVRDLRDMVEEDLKSDAPLRAAQEARIKGKLNENEARLDRLADAVADGVLDADTYRRRREAILHERRQAEDELRELRRPRTADERMEKFELAYEAYLGLISENPSKIRASVEKSTSNLSVEEKSLVITPRSPLLEVAKLRLDQQSALDWIELRTSQSMKLALDMITNKITERRIATTTLSYLLRDDADALASDTDHIMPSTIRDSID